jgi:hypothetical protein
MGTVKALAAAGAVLGCGLAVHPLCGFQLLVLSLSIAYVRSVTCSTAKRS